MPETSDIIANAMTDLPSLWPMRLMRSEFMREFGNLDHTNLPSRPIPLARLRFAQKVPDVVSTLLDLGITTLQDLEAKRLREMHSQQSVGSNLGGALGEQLEQLESVGHFCLKQIAQDLELEALAESKPVVHDFNCVIVDPEVLRSLDNLVSGKSQISLRSFFNLCTLTESVVLTEKVFTPYEAGTCEYGITA